MLLLRVVASKMHHDRSYRRLTRREHKLRYSVALIALVTRPWSLSLRHNSELKSLSYSGLSDEQRYDPGESHSPKEAYQDQQRMHPLLAISSKLLSRSCIIFCFRFCLRRRRQNHAVNNVNYTIARSNVSSNNVCIVDSDSFIYFNG